MGISFLEEIKSKIRRKPSWWSFIPGLSGDYANSIYPYIYLSKNDFEKCMSDNLDHKLIATLIHEKVHLNSQKGTGVCKFIFKYFFSRKFRFEEEILAIEPQMRYLKEHNEGFDIEERAKNLSGPMYLWATSYSVAKRVLYQIWSSTK